MKNPPKFLESKNTKTLHAGSLILGIFMVVAFIKSSQIYAFQETGGIHFEWISRLEYRFWFLHILLATPGCILISWGLCPIWMPRIKSLWGKISLLSEKEWLMLGGLFFVFLFFINSIGRQFFLYGLPITDDENMVRFGAEIINSGRFMVPVLEPDGAYTQLFTYRHEGQVTSLDYPGAILFYALALKSGLGSALYALISAATGFFMFLSARIVAGNKGGLLMAMIWLTSPMARSLGLTMHNHILAQCFFSMTLFAYLKIIVANDRRIRIAICFGLGGSLAFFCRSAEAGFLLFPLLVHCFIRLKNDKSMFRLLAVAGGLALLTLVIYALYNTQTTGRLMPARFGPGQFQITPKNPVPIFDRLGTHLAHNWSLFLIMAVGPLGMLAASLAFYKRPPWCTTLAISGIALLSLSFFHDDVGIHSVGPIHLSDLVALAALFAVCGIKIIMSWCRQKTPEARDFCLSIILGSALGAMSLFTFFQCSSLKNMTGIQAMVYDLVDNHVETPAVVFGKDFQNLFKINAELGSIGAWVNQLPPPDPDLKSPLIFVKENETTEAVFQKFKNRNFYRLIYEKRQLPRIEKIPSPIEVDRN